MLGVDGYGIKYVPDGKDEWKSATADGEETSVVLEGLELGSRYQVKVCSWVDTPFGRIVGEFGGSKLSDELPIEQEVPGKLNAIKVKSKQDTAIIKWE